MPIDHTCECGKTAKIEAVPQSVFDARLKELASQRDGFKNEAATLAAARAKLEADSASWKTAAEKLAAVEAKAEEDGALAAANLRTDAAPHHRGWLRDLYNAAPKPETGDKPPFADWLKAQAAAPDADPFILALRATPGSPAALANPANPQTSNTPARPPVTLPPTPNTQPPVPGGDPRAALVAKMAADAAAGRPWSLEAAEKALEPFKT